MTETITTPMSGFDRLETQMVREAVRVCGELYIEEIGRKAVQAYANEEAKRNQFIADGWTFPTTVSLHLLATQANLSVMWVQLRGQAPLMDAVLNTTVKLRGYYSPTDWEQLVRSLSDGLSVLRKARHSVMDDVATSPFESQPGAEELLGDNIWAVTLVLLSYMPLMSIPKTLQAIMQIPVRASDKAGPVS